MCRLSGVEHDSQRRNWDYTRPINTKTLRYFGDSNPLLNEVWTNVTWHLTIKNKYGKGLILSLSFTLTQYLELCRRLLYIYCSNTPSTPLSNIFKLNYKKRNRNIYFSEVPIKPVACQPKAHDYVWFNNSCNAKAATRDSGRWAPAIGPSVVDGMAGSNDIDVQVTVYRDTFL